MAAEIQGQFGGMVTFEFAGQTITISDAEVMLDVGRYDVTAKANQDLTGAYEMKPKLPGAEIKFRNVGDVDWDGLLLLIGNATIVEQTNGRQHLFTGTRMIGTPKVNVSTGEVDGLRIEGGTYTRLNNS